jgi:hypothetical protein
VHLLGNKESGRSGFFEEFLVSRDLIDEFADGIG